MDLTGFQGIRPSYYDSDQGATGFENKLRNAQKSSAAEGAAAKDAKSLDAATRDLESVFIYMLLKEMRKTVHETKLINGGRGEEIFRDMLDEEMSKKMAAGPGEGIGIAKMLYDQLSRPVISKQSAEQAQNIQGTAITQPEEKK
ncbi:MAG: rod-binding protein [bacterium]